MNRKIFFISIFVLVIFGGYFVYAFIKQFSEMPYPTSSSEWGSAGDYFGGFLNPVIGLINLIVLIHITLLVSRKDDRRWTNDMINKAHEELLSEIAKIEIGSSPEIYSNLGMFLYGFTYRNRWLFDDREKEFLRVIKEFGDSIRKIEISAIQINVKAIDLNKQFERIIKNNEGLLQGEIEKIKMHCLDICLYDEYRIQLVNYMRLTMIGRNPKKVFKHDKVAKAREAYDLFHSSKKRQLEFEESRKV